MNDARKLAALLLCFLPIWAQAIHIIGGEMTYRFVEKRGPDTNRYEVKMLVYRDCDSGGGSLDAQAPIGVFRGSATSATLLFSLKAALNGPVPVPPVIPPCADASMVTGACVELGTYVFTVDLPILPNASYFIVYQRCCRTNFISNIPNPGSWGATYMVELTPLAQALENSSPTFNDPPPTFICVNFPLDFDHSAFDAEGDSLVYSFCRSLHGGGQGGGANNCNSPQPNPPCPPPFSFVPFLAPYSEASPMGGDPIVKIDSFSGHLSGKPLALGQFVVGICIREYRNGQLLSAVFRDFQFNVVDCSPLVAASIEGNSPNSDQNFILRRCGDKQVNIKNLTVLTPDILSWHWEFDLHNGQTKESDDWDFAHVFDSFGLYQGRLFLEGKNDCDDTAWVELEVRPGVTADFSFEWDTCSINPVEFNDLSKPGGSNQIVDWDWRFSILDTSAAQNPAYLFPAFGQYPVKLTVTDDDGCTAERAVVVDWQPKLPPDIPPLPFLKKCLPGAIDFELFQDTAWASKSKIEWDFGDGERLVSNIANPSHRYVDAGSFSPSVRIETEHRCVSLDTFRNAVSTHFSPIARFDFSPQKPSNLDNEVRFDDRSDGQIVRWLWSFGDGQASEWPDAIHVFQDTGLHQTQLWVETIDGCQDSTAQLIDVKPCVRLYFPNAFRPTDGNNAFGNSFFGPLGILPSFSNYEMKVFDRWGELLFDSRDPEAQWDGRRLRDGRTMPPGAYVWFVRFSGPRGEPYDFEGSVTLF